MPKPWENKDLIGDVFMSRYPIKEEFKVYAKFTPPFRSAKMAGWMGTMMKPPKWLWNDPQISVRRESIGGYDNGSIELFIMEPKDIETKKCLIYYHGGGFMLEGAEYHYLNAKQYVLETPCKVLFVQYRRAPKHPFPVLTEDCYEALKWSIENAASLGIDEIAVGGDSAGGCLAAAVSLMARNRLKFKPAFQLLIYPFTNCSLESESNRRFTDTPMWNSKLSKIMLKGYLPDRNVENLMYASPIMAEDFSNLPHAYIETAEFDCLHDDGINYAQKLRAAGIPVELNETKGTMHGFDIAQNALTTKQAIGTRIQYMRTHFSS